MHEFQPVRCGRYFLIDKLAVGGMADVFAALTLGDLGFEKYLVVKKIHPHLLAPQFVEMFRTEASISALLEHPNIVQVYDFGQDGDGYYIAMQWVFGRSLKETLRRLSRARRLLPVPVAVAIVAEVLRALDYAHHLTHPSGRDVTVVHRDATPSNILVGFDGRTKLADFGIAKVLSVADDATEVGLVKGKAPYLSPEQARGCPATPASDLFTVGIVLHEALTGRRLFTGENDLATLERVKGLDPEPPSHLNGAVPQSLDAVVMKTLAKAPDQRFKSAAAMLEALGAAGVEPAPPSEVGRFMDTHFYRERTSDQVRLEEGRQRALRLHDMEDEPTTMIHTRAEVARSQAAALIDRLSQPAEVTFPGVLHSMRSMYDAEPEAADVTGRILIVDDSDPTRKVLTRVLTKAGHAVLEASDGYRAMARLDEEPVDLVLLDVEMPGIDGFGVLEMIRERWPLVELPVVMVTGLHGGDEVIRALRLGANDYIAKPFEHQIVRARVQTQLMVRVGFETLKKADDCYRTYALNTTDLILQMTANGTILFASPSAKDLLGRTAEQLIGLPFYDYVHKLDLPVMTDKLGKLLLTGEHQAMIHRMQHRDGGYLWFETRVQPIVDPQTRLVTGIQGSARDITRFRQGVGEAG